MHPSPPSLPSSPRRRVAARLNAEWDHLLAGRRSRAVPDRWRADPRIAPYSTLAELLAACGRSGGLPEAEADQVLAAVVACAADDERAARVVLQRVVGGLVLAAIRRSRRGPWDVQELFDDLVAHAWTVIRTYPLARRPAKIAVNILRDTEYLSCVRPFRLRRVAEEATPSAGFASCAAAIDGRPADRALEPAEEVAGLMDALQRAGLPRADLHLLWRIHVEGVGIAQLAADLAVCERTVRNRRAAALERAGRLLAA